MPKCRNLDVWSNACEFAETIYREFADLKDFGFKDQVTRSAVSVASNIAEGSQRGSNREFIRYLRIAMGSCEECRTQLYIASRIGYITEPVFENADLSAERINAQLAGLIRYLKAHDNNNPKPKNQNL